MKKSKEHSCGKKSLPEMEKELRTRSQKVTGQRQAILEILSNRHGPMSNKEIHQALCGGQCDLATVYRSMHLLEKMGLVKRFEFGDGIARFELLGKGDDGHHHHLVCTGCSEIVEIQECFPRSLEKQVAKKNGFKAVTHRLEFFGVCPRCQSMD